MVKFQIKLMRKTMFRQRLLTTLVLVPLVLMALYYANPWMLGAVLLSIIVAGGWEWMQLIPVVRLSHKIIFLSVLLLAVWACAYWLDYWLAAGLVLWGFIFIAVLTFPASQMVWGHPVIVGGACLLLLPLLGSVMVAVYLYPQGKDLVVYLLSLVWAADIGAYLTGKWCGRHKLIPQVSPGKTVEGALGGLLTALLVAFFAYLYFQPANVIIWFVTATATILISMLGDLFISMLKRRSQLKDTGHIFPGHGGVLDRLDSMIAALPIFYIGMRFMPAGY